MFGLFGGGNPYTELSRKKIRDVMTSDVVTIRQETSLSEAAHTMIGAHISSLVVTRGESPLGILTERDFIKKLDMKQSSTKGLTVKDLLTKKLVTLTSKDSIFAAQKTMRDNQFRKVVISDNGVLSGIITQTDLCREVAALRNGVAGTPLVSQIMTHKVVTVSPDDKFEKVKKILAQKDMGSVVVIKNDEILGMFTEFDIVSEYYLNPNKLKNSYMSDLMTSPVVCITPDFDTATANRLMIERNFRRLPILSNGKLVGIVTQTDIANSLYAFIERNREVPFKRDNSKPPQVVTKRKGVMMLLEQKKN